MGMSWEAAGACVCMHAGPMQQPSPTNHHPPPTTNNANTKQQYGTIADCWTELGDFENAALWYDKYINAMNATEGSPV